jgi:hypothetical protein
MGQRQLAGSCFSGLTKIRRGSDRQLLLVSRVCEWICVLALELRPIEEVSSVAEPNLS